MEAEISFLVETEGVLCESSALGTALHTVVLEMTPAMDKLPEKMAPACAVQRASGAEGSSRMKGWSRTEWACDEE